jgi:hypothetical protein
LFGSISAGVSFGDWRRLFVPSATRSRTSLLRRLRPVRRVRRRGRLAEVCPVAGTATDPALRHLARSGVASDPTGRALGRHAAALLLGCVRALVEREPRR